MYQQRVGEGDGRGLQPLAAADLPLASLCRSVEIELAPLLGENAPPPLAPVNGVLS